MGQTLSVEQRKIRDMGGCIGQSLKLESLRELGLVDESGELTDEIWARQKITDDGKIVIDVSSEIADERKNPRTGSD